MNKGFTLVELLVTIAIIGILSAVMLASLNEARCRENPTLDVCSTSSKQVDSSRW